MRGGVVQEGGCFPLRPRGDGWSEVHSETPPGQDPSGRATAPGKRARLDFIHDFGDNRKVNFSGAGVRRKRAGRILIGAFLFLAWGTQPRGAHGHDIGQVSKASVVPSSGDMERDLLLLLNRERTSRNLPALRLSPALARLARAHSEEMAGLDNLAHESADGKTPTDRLSDAGVDFSASGENVGFSSTVSVEIMHRTFMNSRGHRENCLNREFDEVGIGIAPGPRASWYITEDFIHGVNRLTAADVRALVLRALDEARARSGRPAMVHVAELDRTAQAFAEARAAGRELPSLPGFFGETLVRFTMGPLPNEIASSLGNTDLRGYGRAGIGVRFDRSTEYPGGGYTVCALIVADNTSSTPDDLERLLTVLGAANAVREQKGLRRLELDHDLCRKADILIRWKQGENVGGPRAPGKNEYYSTSSHLDSIGKALGTGLGEPGFARIGISTVPMQTRNGRPDGYAVAVILDR